MIRLPKTAIESAWVSVGTYAMYAAMFGVTILINRRYGTAELGRFGLAWAVAQLTVQAAISGFSGIHKRDVAYGGRGVRELVSETLAVRFLTLGLILAAASVILMALGLEDRVAMAILIVALAKAIEAIGLTFAETLQALGENRTFAVLSATNAAVLLGAVGVVWALQLGSTTIYLATVLAAAVYTAAALAAFIQRHERPYVRATRTRMRELIRESWPLIVNAVVFVLAGRAAVIAVGVQAGETQAGVYTFASGVVGSLAVVASAIGIVVFPELCRMFVRSPEALRSRMYRLSGTLGIVGVGALVLLALVRRPLIALYGDLPSYAADVLLALGVGLVPIFGAMGTNYMFTAIGAQKEGMYMAFINALLVVSLVIPLTHYFGAIGAAAAVSMTQAVMWVVAFVWLDCRHLSKFARQEEAHAAG